MRHNATFPLCFQEIQTQLKKEKGLYMDQIRSDLRSFRQKMDDTSQMLREANSRFIKGFKSVTMLLCAYTRVPSENLFKKMRMFLSMESPECFDWIFRRCLKQILLKRFYMKLSEKFEWIHWLSPRGNILCFFIKTFIRTIKWIVKALQFVKNAMRKKKQFIAVFF